MFITMYFDTIQRDARIIIRAKGMQFQGQLFHIWAKAHKSRQAPLVARGLPDPVFHAFPLSRVRAWGWGVNQITVR